MKKTLGAIAISAATTLFIGCGGGQTNQLPQASAASAPLPSWYVNPYSVAPDAMNGVSCVPIPQGGLDIARQQSINSAMSTLAGQVDSAVSGLQKRYDALTSENGSASTAVDFESISKTVVSQSLRGARVIRGERIELDGEYNFCSLVTLDPVKTQALLDGILDASGANLPADDNAVLRKEWEKLQTQQDLEQ